jgi:hypothetical protein
MATEYATLREKIAAEKHERLERYATFELAWSEARAAGMAAGNACTPTPMIVGPADILINGAPVLTRAHYVSEGACGFAWIVHPDGNSSFARWAKKHRNARREYGGGVCLYWVGEFNQSMARKKAFADAFAETLRSHGIPANARSRMD